MRMKIWTLLYLSLFMICSLKVAGAGMEQTARGKFYIVGMGSAPDLVTLRAIEVIKQSDIVIVENDYEQELWKDYIKGKEVWFCPHTFRVLYGLDAEAAKNEKMRAKAEYSTQLRQQLIAKIRSALEKGEIVASLQGGDPMMYGLTLFLEMLPEDTPSEIVPGVGAFQAVSAAVKMSPPYGYDTSAVILTMADWPGRIDTNEKLMATGSSMIFYTMLLDYPTVFPQLQRHYPAETPVAVVIDAGDRKNQKVIRSTIGRFLQDVDYKNFPAERHTLLVGKFLEVGQMRKDFVPEIEKTH
jgi:precorrin-4/cobalt-precorrin-4 C11-methyltransferase